MALAIPSQAKRRMSDELLICCLIFLLIMKY